MKNNFKNIITFYIIFVIIILVFYFYSTKIVYNNLKVINHFDSSDSSLVTKIPNKILIHNEYLGDITINDNLLMNDILKYFSNITVYNSSTQNKIKNNNVVNLSGKIFYSNGSTQDFKINNSLTLNNKNYSSNSYSINTLRNTLFSCLYTYDNIINILRNSKTKIVYKAHNTSYTLDSNKRNKLIASLKKFKTMEDNKDFLDTNLNEKPEGVFNIYINSNNSLNSNNTIYLIVYKKYLIVQYLGDENGKNIYIKGDLNETYFK